MKLKKLRINNFGKLNNKDISFEPGINVVYGENESGKSTLLNFILSMIYGASKNKNGKDMSDYDRYLPWIGEEYSGKFEYVLDNNEEYEVFRDFKKKNPVIFNLNKEDISKDFTIDRSKGIAYFEDQTGIDETTFINTALIEQQSVRVDRSSQNSIVQKISNLVETGEDNVSYKKTIDKIQKRQLEEIGTEKSQARPLNILNKNIEDLKRKKEEFDLYTLDNSGMTLENIKKELEEERNKLFFLRELKEQSDIYVSKIQEIEYMTKDIDNTKLRLDVLNRNLKEKNILKSKKVKKKNFIMNILLFIITVAMIVGIIMYLNLLYLIIPGILLLLNIISIIVKLEINKNIRRFENLSIEKIKNEIEILLRDANRKRREINLKEQEIDNQMDQIRIEIYEKYKDKVDEEFISECYDNIGQDFNLYIEEVSNNVNELSVNLAVVDNQNKTNIDKINQLRIIEENLEELKLEREELLELNKSYNLAKECIELANNEMKKNVSPRFIANLNDIISKISNDKYNNVVLSEEEGMKIELSNGNYINLSSLSTGTIDELYLGLRLSALNEIADETIPLFLDETFAYFDEERLRNILNYMYNNFLENQIIIFTCSRREIEALNDLKINYNLINLFKND